MRQVPVYVRLAPVALFVLSGTCAGQPQGQGISMDISRFEQTFDAALRERGAAYVEARNAIVAAGRSVLPALEVKQQSPDWRIAWQARILTGWITRPELFQQCVAYSEGKLPGTPGITGKFRPTERIREITGLGPAVVPCLVEMTIKIRPLDPEQRAAVFGALKAMSASEVAAPLTELLTDADPDLRRSAAGALGAVGDAGAVVPLLSTLRDDSQPEAVRATAAESLGMLGAAQASPVLREIVGSTRLGVDLRKAAARALVTLKDAAAPAAVGQAASGTTDLSLLIVLIEALGSFGDRSSVPMLQRFEKHNEQAVQEAARESLRKIAAR